MHILHTIPYTFPKLLKKEKLLNNQELQRPLVGGSW